ncbi:CoA ester lyase [Pseudomonas fluorescens]|uniref:HpcH/HpaI aldolase/citrate lyase family protein n=1 Tax=Pseudomonas fluorescens TaxID=294 RepID=UPI002ACA6E65|nr:CoA ester lyase [Pseudomonas fluorescens]MDZ5431939.1 CoA ester lyase [Pseudomonas fluorescens]
MVNHLFKAPIAPLFVPGDKPERFHTAAASGADAVILDLEDAVAPDRRAFARKAVAEHTISNVPVIVRLNAHITDDFALDLDALRETPFDALMLSKAQHADDVLAVHARLGREVPIIVLVETALAFADLGRLLAASGVVLAAFGSLDLALDLGCTPNREALAYTRSQLVLACRIAGLESPLDGVCTSLDDLDLISEESRHAAILGFGGKLVIHPRQVASIQAAFLPDEKDLEWAHAVLAAQPGGEAVRVGGSMVDRPLIERAKRILAHQATPKQFPGKSQ